MPKIWQNMKKILVQLALCPFFGWFRIIPKNFEFEYPIHHLFRLLEINFWKLVVQNSNKFWKLKFPKWRSIYYNTVFYNIVHIFFKNLSELFYNTKKNHIFFSFFEGKSNPGRTCSTNSVCGRCSNGGIGILWWLKEPRKRWQIENKTSGDNRQ